MCKCKGLHTAFGSFIYQGGNSLSTRKKTLSYRLKNDRKAFLNYSPMSFEMGGEEIKGGIKRHI